MNVQEHGEKLNFLHLLGERVFLKKLTLQISIQKLELL